MKIKELLHNRKIMMVAAATVVVIIIVIVVIARRKKKADKADNTSGSGGSSSGVVALPVASYPLRPFSITGEYTAEAGTYGKQIATLQRGLNQKYNCKLAVDGKFGPETTQALCDNILCPEENLYTEAVYMNIVTKFPI